MPRKRPVGTVGQRATRTGWWVRYWDHRGKRRCLYGGKTEEAARAKLTSLVERDESIRSGIAREALLATFAADELFDLARGRLAERSFEAFSGRILRAAEHFGDLPMLDVSVADAEDFLAKLTRSGSAPLTVRAYRSALSVAWRAAIKRNAAKVNIWTGLETPKAQRRAVHFLDEDGLRRLYAKTPAPLRGFVSFLGETGMRRGEALRVRWRDVGKARILVRISKTGRVREVPILASTRQLLDSIGPGRPERRVFAEIAPRWTRRSKRFWRRARRRARLPPDFRLHDLRHCRASLLVRAGVPAPTVGRWLGMSAALVLDRYGMHAPANELDLAVERVESARRRTDRGRRSSSAGPSRRRGSSRSRRKP
jgi:integrase